MKTLFLVFLFSSFIRISFAQQMTIEEWNKEAETNIRCLPKYGHVQKPPELIAADNKFIQAALSEIPNSREASEHMIDLGFRYLYQDVKTAMYRFNQAYLLDSTNSDIYWGYGGVYMILQDYVRAREQYEEGLRVDSLNTRIMTDYGTWFMVQDNADSAISYLSKSYKIDSTNQNTSYKLAVCYYYQDDCENAISYYQICKALGGKPITREFDDSLNNKCKLRLSNPENNNHPVPTPF